MYTLLKAPTPITVPGGMPGPLGGSPGTGEDLIKLYAETKAGLLKENGAYDKRSVYTGKSVPRISVTQAEQYFSFWRATAERLLYKLADAGRPQWSLQKAFYDATSRYTTWLAKYGAQRSYKYVSFVAADEYFQLLGRFVQEIDAGVWTGYNTETDWENAISSLKWGWVTAPERVWTAGKKAVDAIAKASGDLWWLVKWGSVALVGAYAYSIATKKESSS